MDKPWKVHCLAWKGRCLARNLHLPNIAFFLSFFRCANFCELMRNKISGKKLGNAAFDAAFDAK